MNAVVASFSAETLKLRKRPATMMLAAILVAVIVMFGYVSIYLISEKRGDGADPGELALLEQLLYTQNIVPVVLNILKQFGAPIALIFGAMAAGSEYGWGTIKTIFTQRPARLGVLAGQMLGLAALVGAGVVLSFGAAFAAALVVAELKESAATMPAWGGLIAGMGAAWLILSAWAMIGLMLANLFRGTSFAIGAGLIYGLAIETLIAGLAYEVALFKTLQYGLPGANASALANTFTLAGRAPDAGGLIGPGQAIAVLLAYIVGSGIITALSQRRDMV